MTKVKIEFNHTRPDKTHDHVKSIEILSGFFLITFNPNEHGILYTYYPRDIVGKIEVMEEY